MFWIKSRKEEQKGLPQYQRDFDLSPQGDHYMFWEYLEVGKLVETLSLGFFPCPLRHPAWVYYAFKPVMPFIS